ncbi:hypothetical protein ILUMI_11511 [Ignelater luminosus]|uniref:Uncharacterized protein n=1 Tax=Ignelater luminosus TaxID=2038154 RepID=A0A8K0D0C6_IGNLU|nr:hypothetical protein ILUMI_11511 [Ignelater luminosus]
MDASGAIIEDDILVEYVRSMTSDDPRNILLLLVAQLRPLSEISNLSVSDTISIISPEGSFLNLSSNELLNIENSPGPSASTTSSDIVDDTFSYEEAVDGSNKELSFKKLIVYQQVLNSKEWKDLIQTRMAPNRYNTTTAFLIEKYGISVPEFARRNLGEAIINIFPNLRNNLDLQAM